AENKPQRTRTRRVGPGPLQRELRRHLLRLGAPWRLARQCLLPAWSTGGQATGATHPPTRFIFLFRTRTNVAVTHRTTKRIGEKTRHSALAVGHVSKVFTGDLVPVLREYDRTLRLTLIAEFKCRHAPVLSIAWSFGKCC